MFRSRVAFFVVGNNAPSIINLGFESSAPTLNYGYQLLILLILPFVLVGLRNPKSVRIAVWRKGSMADQENGNRGIDVH